VVNGDAEEIPQHQRPIVSAIRQWAVATVVEEVDRVDPPTDEVHE